MILGSGCFDWIRNHDGYHFRTTINTFLYTLFTQLYLQTIRTYPGRQHPLYVLFVAHWKHHDNLLIRLEIKVIERFKMRQCSILSFVQNGDPAGQTAVTAIHNGEVLLCLLAVQIMSNLICNIFTVNLGYQATQLSHPKLYLYIQKWAQLSGFSASGMGNQCI